MSRYGRRAFGLLREMTHALRRKYNLTEFLWGVSLLGRYVFRGRQCAHRRCRGWWLALIIANGGACTDEENGLSLTRFIVSALPPYPPGCPIARSIASLTAE
jgi:hypothetical protein